MTDEYRNGQREKIDRAARYTDFIRDEWRPQVDADRVLFRAQIANLLHDLEELTNAVNSLRRTILGFAFSIAGSAILFALTVLAATGKI